MNNRFLSQTWMNYTKCLYFGQLQHRLVCVFCFLINQNSFMSFLINFLPLPSSLFFFLHLPSSIFSHGQHWKVEVGAVRNKVLSGHIRLCMALIFSPNTLYWSSPKNLCCFTFSPYFNTLSTSVSLF